MCGGFTCSKNALIALNMLYIVVAFILIGVAVYGRAASLVTNLPIIGGILACGIILILISLLGMMGAVKHHQVMLFFYMLILFLLFLIQFSVACACLGVNQSQQEQLAQQGWNRVDNATRANVQKTFTCCGFDAEVDKLLPHPECFDVTVRMRCCSDAEHKVCDCPGGCLHKLQSTISYAFQLCGWIGLFFSFTEVVGIFLTKRYRNQQDPEHLKAIAVFPSHNTFTY
ncbi:tetraspanin-31-B isoform X1 [Dendroctonus ponderosae]|uniref:Tetraspanin n=1 Tax=Dendroctonus ponderosae TaxID=77166 RepID=A0AAR5PQ77_DENPD|nr:tetraspanin-31-B isoform X1 [Dendroctonus ponderosae]